MEDIVTRLSKISEKWRWANPEVHDICKDAIFEIMLLRTRIEGKVASSQSPNELGWGKGKDE